MDVLIIEDELLAQQKLQSMLLASSAEIRVVATLASVRETIQWLYQNPKPDLAFVDIQLSDDHSFEIFRQYNVDFPVVFTTAYDKYVLQSFEFNAVDYILKPVTAERLKLAFSKIRKLEQHFLQGNVWKMIQNERAPATVTRLVAKKGTDFVAVNVADIAYFFTEHKIVFLREFGGRQLIVDNTLAELESMLDVSQFFRLNRKYLCRAEAIERFKPDQGKIEIHLTPETREPIHISKENAPAFREWIGAK